MKSKKERLPFFARRKLIGLGDSVVVSLPPVWMKQHGLKIGDEVNMLANTDIKIAASSADAKKIYSIVSKLVDEADVE